VMKPTLSVLLIGLAAGCLMSCKGPTAPEVQAGAKPDAAEKAADPFFDTRSLQSSYWQRAMAHYKPPAEGDFVSLPDTGALASETAAAPTTPVASTPASTPAPQAPAAAKPPAPVPSELPFGTRIPGQPGLVKSPYDAAGRSVDVRDFAPGQMARCPYSGKVFRVPPK